ncbi:ParA family protein [Croceitalea sp. MTPC9]|uniref:ParA family protein n=1 Tax=unclassified Croceitalea TaxID=2632280 RepID=UPI002B3B088D|nr:ParA family protein [Croceitalea sp. MTPC6]GMN18506.1 ParA family protein [Croceitalea sp. MTPC9]
MSITAFMNQKGGVGKTTATINLAVQAALRSRVLLIDADEQGSLSKQFGITNPKTSIKEALLGKPFEVVNVRKNLDVLPADGNLVDIEMYLTGLVGREKKLSKALKKIKDDYDYIFIDCPSNTSIVTINALAFADYVVLPILLDILSIEGIDHMVKYITMIKEEANEDLSILGILINQFEERTKVTDILLGEIEERGWEEILFKTKIRKNVTVKESQAFRKPIFDYSKNSTGAKDYVALGKEILSKINKLEKV